MSVEINGFSVDAPVVTVEDSSLVASAQDVPAEVAEVLSSATSHMTMAEAAAEAASKEVASIERARAGMVMSLRAQREQLVSAMNRLDGALEILGEPVAVESGVESDDEDDDDGESEKQAAFRGSKGASSPKAKTKIKAKAGRKPAAVSAAPPARTQARSVGRKSSHVKGGGSKTIGESILAILGRGARLTGAEISSKLSEMGFANAKTSTHPTLMRMINNKSIRTQGKRRERVYFVG